MNFISFKTVFIFFFSLLLFLGCSKQKIQSDDLLLKQESEPGWYIDPPKNNALYIYGAGYGESKSEAYKDALRSISSTFMIKLSSSLKSTTKSESFSGVDIYSKVFERNIKIVTEKIKFTNIEIYKTKKLKEGIYYLLRINRVAFFENIKKELEMEDQFLDKRFLSIKEYPKYEQFIMIKELIPKIEDLKTKVNILNIIDNSFEQSSYLEKYNSYIDRVENIKNALSFKIVSNLDKGYFKDVIFEFMGGKGLRLVGNTFSDIKIDLKNKVIYNKLPRWYIVKVTTTFLVISENKIVSSKIIRTVGRSTVSYEGALVDASKSFKYKLKEEDLWEIF